MSSERPKRTLAEPNSYQNLRGKNNRPETYLYVYTGGELKNWTLHRASAVKPP